MKPAVKWTLLVVAAALVVAGGMRLMADRKAQATAAATVAAPAKAQTLVELAPTDVVTAQVREIAQGLPISGTLKAVNTALVKARVAGELQGLTVREGDVVKAGQVVARVDSSDLLARVKQAQEQADAAKAQIDIAQRQWDNNKALVDQGFISKTALDTSLNNLNVAQSNHKAALAAIDVAKKSLDDAVLRAPISGVVSQRLAQPGERVGIDARVIEIVDMSRLELEASLGAGDSMAVRVGQSATLQVEGGRDTVVARVARINPSAQAGSRSVLVYLSLEQTTGLRQGLFAQGTLGTAQAALLAVPLSAVRTDKPNPYVQIVENDRVAHKVVQTGVRGSDARNATRETLVAVDGIGAGTMVLQGSVGSLREGTTVKFTASAKP
jgi:RND family efflux transporter MFP subunit